MSALPVESFDATPRHLRFPRVTMGTLLRVARAEPEPIVRQSGGHAITDAAIPCPPSLRQYLRGDSDAEYARLLRAIHGACCEGRGKQLAGTFDPKGEAMEALRRQLLADPAADAVTPLVRALVPPVPCPTCRAPFIRYTSRQVYCRQRCRQLANAAGQIAELRRVAKAANHGG